MLFICQLQDYQRRLALSTPSAPRFSWAQREHWTLQGPDAKKERKRLESERLVEERRQKKEKQALEAKPTCCGDAHLRPCNATTHASLSNSRIARYR